MSRASVTIRSAKDRALLTKWAQQAPFGTRVEWKAPRRSNDQNSFLWAALTDIAMQVTWHGRMLSADKWKILFMDALNHDADLAPRINGEGMVNIGMSSSDLTKAEFSDLLEILLAFGAEHGVQFHEPGAFPSSSAQINSGASASVLSSHTGAPSAPGPAASDPAGVAGAVATSQAAPVISFGEQL